MGRVSAILWIGFLWGCNGQPPVSGLLPDSPEIHSTASPEPPAGSALPPQLLRIFRDLGTVRTGTKHDVEFEIQNPSDVDWTLRDITKTCRCVVAEPVPQIIHKQSSTRLKLTIQAGEASGDFDRQVRLNFTNRPGPVVLEVKTRMRTPLYVTRRDLRFPSSPPGTSTPATVRVENWSDANWEGLEVVPGVDWIQAQVGPSQAPVIAPQGPGLHVRQWWEITLTTHPPLELTGTLTSSIVIRAVGAEYSHTLPAVVERPHPVISRPPALIVSRGASAAGSSSDGKTLVATLSLTSTSPAKSFQVLSVIGKQLDGFEVRFEHTSPTEAHVRVVIPPGHTGGISGRVVVQFAEGLPDLIIPVAGGV